MARCQLVVGTAAPALVRIIRWSDPDTSVIDTIHDHLNHHPLDFVEADLVAALVVELSRPRRGMVGHHRGLLKRATVFKTGRNPGGAERVIADRRRDVGSLGASADHQERDSLGQGGFAQLGRAAAKGAEQRCLWGAAQLAAVEISDQTGAVSRNRPIVTACPGCRWCCNPRRY